MGVIVTDVMDPGWILGIFLVFRGSRNRSATANRAGKAAQPPFLRAGDEGKIQARRLPLSAGQKSPLNAGFDHYVVSTPRLAVVTGF